MNKPTVVNDLLQTAVCTRLYFTSLSPIRYQVTFRLWIIGLLRISMMPYRILYMLYSVEGRGERARAPLSPDEHVWSHIKEGGVGT